MKLELCAVQPIDQKMVHKQLATTANIKDFVGIGRYARGQKHRQRHQGPRREAIPMHSRAGEMLHPGASSRE
jgi:hypothetical protein